MKRVGAVTMALLLASLLVGCAGEEDEGATQQEEVESKEVEVGGFTVLGPTGEEISLPEVTAKPEDVENYLQRVRPIIRYSARDLSRFVDPNVTLQDQTLTISLEVESIQQADEAVEDGLGALRQVNPPEEGLGLLHEQLVAAYERALPAYDDMLEAFASEDVNRLVEEAREGLPEIELFNVTTRALLQELERVAGEEAGQDEPVENIMGEGVRGGSTDSYSGSYRF